VKPIEQFLTELCLAWNPSETKTLSILGSTALMLQTTYHRGTRDSDVLETAEIDSKCKRRLLQLGGPGTRLASRHHIHLDIVANGLPFLPHAPTWVRLSIPGLPDAVRIQALAVVDVVVSKLKRFNANDQSDISAMVELDLVPHEQLLLRFQSAVDLFACDARAEDLPRYVDNLNDIERDVYGVAESSVHLPGWIG